MYSTFQILMAVIGGISAVFIAFAAIAHAKSAKESRNPNLQKRKVMVMGAYAVALAFMTPASLIDSPIYTGIMQVAMGLAILSIVSIPCGIELFNRKGFRAARNLLFIVLGGIYMFLAATSFLL